MGDKCPKGMTRVSGGKTTYESYSFPNGPTRSTAHGKSTYHGYDDRIPDQYKLSMRLQRTKYSKVVTRRKKKKVASFCITPLVTYPDFKKYYYKNNLHKKWSSGNYEFFNKENWKNTGAVRWVDIGTAKAYCRTMYGSKASFPTEVQWERARQQGKINIKNLTSYEEWLSTKVATPKGKYRLVAHSYYDDKGVKRIRYADGEKVVASANHVFRCIVSQRRSGGAIEIGVGGSYGTQIASSRFFSGEVFGRYVFSLHDIVNPFLLLGVKAGHVDDDRASYFVSVKAGGGLRFQWGKNSPAHFSLALYGGPVFTNKGYKALVGGEGSIGLRLPLFRDTLLIWDLMSIGYDVFLTKGTREKVYAQMKVAIQF